MATANAMGNKLPLFVIGKAKNPPCFKNVKFLPCRYRNQRKSWMDGKLFEGWPQRARQDVCFWRKKCCFCDRQLPCPSSYWQPKLNQVVFRTTWYYFQDPTNGSRCHPLIESKISQKCCPENIHSVEKKKNPPQISWLQGMQMLVSAWDALSTQTIMNCFRKSGISTESQETSIAEDDDPYLNYKTKLTTLLLN